MNALGLEGIHSEADNGCFRKIIVEGEKFALIKRNYICKEGKEEKEYIAERIIALCISDPSLNLARGGGEYSFLNIVPEYWSRKIISFLREKEFSFLRETKKPPPGLEELQGIW